MPQTPPPVVSQVIVGAAKEGPSVAGFHKIIDFMRCPQEHKFKHVMGLKKRDSEPSSALLIGVLCHVGRAWWFASQFKASIEACQQAITDHVATYGIANANDAEREAKRLVAAYIEHWRSKPLPLCRAVEYEVGPCPMKPGDPLELFRTARYDDISIYPDALNKLCIGDLKTTSDSISGCVNEYRQNGQFILYQILYKMAKEGQAVFGPSSGMMIDVMTKDAIPKFHRELIVITPFQEHWFIRSMQGWLKAAQQVTQYTEVPRNVSQCCRSVSRKGSFLCDYHQLCHFGSSAVGQYVDKEGNVPNKELVEL